MTTLANTVRWARRGHSELRNKSTSLIDTSNEAFKLPALHALNKSIKYGDLTLATARDLRHLRQEPDQPDNIEELSAHHSLLAIRKKADAMNKARQQLQQAVDELDRTREKLAAERARFEEDRGKGGERVHGMEETLAGVKLQLEERDSERRTLLAMADRLKHDRIVYDLRRFRLQKDLAFLQRQRQIILRENAGHAEEGEKTRRIHQQLLDHLQAEQQERDAHLGSLNAMLGEKLTLSEHAEARRGQLQAIAESTLQDKDTREKNWHKVYLCARFVERLLRDKMAREMAKFATVERAFKQVKTATGIAHTQQLVTKFLNKEHAYGELLGKIADNERSIAELKAEHEDLDRERKTLETHQDELNANRVDSKDLEKEQKGMLLMAERAEHCRLLQEQLADWATKNSRKFDSLEGEQQQQTAQGVVAVVRAYLARLTAAADQVAVVEGKEETSHVGGSNCRVQLEPHSEADIHPKKHNDEHDFVNTQRTEILKNNDKFMRELRKREQEARKARIEAEPKKREPVAEKPPRPVPQEA